MNPPSQLPPHPIPLGCHRAPALGALLHASNLQLVIYFTYGNICFNAILSNHPTLSFSKSPKVCSLCLCLVSQQKKKKKERKNVKNRRQNNQYDWGIFRGDFPRAPTIWVFTKKKLYHFLLMYSSLSPSVSQGRVHCTPLVSQSKSHL